MDDISGEWGEGTLFKTGAAVLLRGDNSGNILYGAMGSSSSSSDITTARFLFSTYLGLAASRTKDGILGGRSSPISGAIDVLASKSFRRQLKGSNRLMRVLNWALVVGKGTSSAAQILAATSCPNICCKREYIPILPWWPSMTFLNMPWRWMRISSGNNDQCFR